MEGGIADVDAQDERYFVEIDGKPTQSEYRLFVEALKAALLIKQQFPHSHVKISEAPGQVH